MPQIAVSAGRACSGAGTLRLPRLGREGSARVRHRPRLRTPHLFHLRAHGIAGQQKTKPDPETLSLMGAARHCRVSNTTITRLIDAGILPCCQITPFAPQEIRRADLESEPVRMAIQRLRATGRISLSGGVSTDQATLFDVNSSKGKGQAS